MTAPRSLRTIHRELMKITLAWAARQGFDPDHAREVRLEAARLNHASYLENIPAYRGLAEEEGCTGAVDFPTIKSKLMSTAGLFKSYDPGWVDAADYARMNGWLSSIFCRRITADISGVSSIDGWIERLAGDRVDVVFSSGTSGTFSFVPRDSESWRLVLAVSACYVAPLLASLGTASPLARLMLKPASRLLPPDAFANLVNAGGMRDFDALFLGFRSGRMGNQNLMMQLAPVFRRHFFLYDMDLTATALRSARLGAHTEDERALLESFRAEVVGRRDENYRKALRHISRSTGEGQKMFLFGAPQQFKELCELAVAEKHHVPLRKGSFILFGGGWKSFSGEALDRETLVRLIADTFELPPDRILEGYSMTEMNVAMVRCAAGRFHIPPVIEPMVYNEALEEMKGEKAGYVGRGAFGFLDTLAVTYPGFIICDDNVTLMEGECACGLAGYAVTDIGRAANREVKGCGGIMGSIRA